MTEHTSEALVRASILHFLRDPGTDASPSAWEYFEDGALYIQNGYVSACGPWQSILTTYPHLAANMACHLDYRGKLLVPGFVDCHVHYPQTAVMGAYGKQLLDWLTDYTFPAEAAFADLGVARASADHFVERLLAHGTTTASVYATVHAHSVDAFFEAASRHDLRMLCGKIMMDRHCPDNLRDTAESSEQDGMALIERWHNTGRLRYTVTPRFAPTSTAAQLDAAARLYASRPDVHLQSHLSENHGEIQWVRELFPNHAHYTDVYRHHGLLGPRAIYGHGIHLSDAELDMLAAHESAIAFCPTSNRFLGSGHFDASKTLAAGVKVGLATDVGGGTSLSMLRTMNAAYEVSMTTPTPLNPWRLWYLASLGGAAALGLDQFIGNFSQGREADFTVLDLEATPDLAWRIRHCKTLEERLFALMTLGDERCVVATHASGKTLHSSISA